MSLGVSLHEVRRHSHGDSGSENTLIHGDNLTVLAAMRDTHAESVRCVYIDPPYNNRERYTHYDDAQSHDEWIAQSAETLRLLHPLLTSNGSLWISIDDTQLHYLKVVADEVFGRGNFVATIVWEHRTTRENRRAFSNNHEYLLVYAKDLKQFTESRNRLPGGSALRSRYKNPDNDPRGPWQSVSVNVQDGHATSSQFYELVAPSGRRHVPPKGRCWVYTRERMNELVSDGRIWFGKDGNAVPRLKRFLSESNLELTPETLWRHDVAGTTRHAKAHVLELFKSEAVFDTPKPEQLLERVLRIATDPGDLVLDAYLGSGTTAAVAHKLERRWVGIEVGEHAITHCVKRLKAVIDGESGGISEAVGWTGGGGFKFMTCATPTAPSVYRAVALA